jgi:hypothetical protein
MENPTYPHYDELAGFALEAWEKLVGAVGIEIASLLSKSNNGNGVARPPYSNWILLEPSGIGLVPIVWCFKTSVFGACQPPADTEEEPHADEERILSKVRSSRCRTASPPFLRLRRGHSLGVQSVSNSFRGITGFGVEAIKRKNHCRRKVPKNSSSN